jgi:hypothetical protein
MVIVTLQHIIDERISFLKEQINSENANCEHHQFDLKYIELAIHSSSSSDEETIARRNVWCVHQELLCALFKAMVCRYSVTHLWKR